MSERQSGGRERWGSRWTRLYRDRRGGKLFGVCAGIADYFGTNVTAVRLAAVVGLLFFTVPTVLAYFAAVLLLEPRPEALFADAREEAFWREARLEPAETVRALRRRERATERRLRAIEAYVTSSRFRVDRELRDLER